MIRFLLRLIFRGQAAEPEPELNILCTVLPGEMMRGL